MELLLKRDQKRAPLFTLVPLRIGGGVVFKLHAKLECTDEEKALMKHYFLNDAVLENSDPMLDIERAKQPAKFVACVVMLVAAFYAFSFVTSQRINSFEMFLSGAGLLVVIGILGLVVSLVMTAVYYFSLRRLITAGQLLNGGRTFPCHSVVELMDMEERLQSLCGKLEATVRASQHWGGRHVSTIPNTSPFPAPPKFAPPSDGISRHLYDLGKRVGDFKKARDEDISKLVPKEAQAASGSSPDGGSGTAAPTPPTPQSPPPIPVRSATNTATVAQPAQSGSRPVTQPPTALSTQPAPSSPRPLSANPVPQPPVLPSSSVVAAQTQRPPEPPVRAQSPATTRFPFERKPLDDFDKPGGGSQG